MTLTTSDIVFVYSGGQNNSDPSKSIGGNPSNNIILGLSNNLFVNLRKEQFQSGYVDYRCFYIANNSYTDTLFNASVFMDSQISGVSNCQIGISKSTDVQSLSFSITPAFGNFKLKYGDYVTANIDWNDDREIFQRNIQDSINGLDIFSGVEVSKTSEDIYSISFSGNNNYRNYDLLEVIDNNLSPSLEVYISKQSIGQPINSIAPLLATSQTIPSGVVFYETSSSSRVYLGDLEPGDLVPIWIKRITTGEVSVDELNGFSFRLSGNLVGNPTVIQTTSLKPCFYYE